MATTPRPTWPDYYRYIAKQDGSDEKNEIDKGLNSLEQINTKFIGHDSRLLNIVVQHPTFNFILLPGASKTVNLLHCCVVDEASGLGHFVGILGNKFSSPRKAVTTKHVSQAFQLPTTTRGVGATSKTPSMSDFMNVATADDFAKLDGSEDGEDLSYIEKNLPSGLFIPPQLFMSTAIEPSVRADALGCRIALIAADGYSEDEPQELAEDLENPVPQSLKDVKQVLIFLWAVAKGLGRTIALKDATLSEQATNELDEVTEKAKSAALLAIQAKVTPSPPEDPVTPADEVAGVQDNGRGDPDPGGRKKRRSDDDPDDDSSGSDASDDYRGDRRRDDRRRGKRSRGRRDRSQSESPNRNRRDRDTDRPSNSELPPNPVPTAPLPPGASMQEMMMFNQGLMIQNMTMFSRQHLATQHREDRKRSMMANLLEEDEALFTLLSAVDWRDNRLQMPDFTTKLMYVKDVNIAWARMSKKIRTWPGRVSQKQFAKFLRTGFIVNDIDECPGGFTLLMFRPLKYPVAKSVKAEQNAIRQMLGETVRFYAENEFRDLTPHSLTRRTPNGGRHRRERSRPSRRCRPDSEVGQERR
jgi:hypothetical protein